MYTTVVMLCQFHVSGRLTDKSDLSKLSGHCTAAVQLPTKYEALSQLYVHVACSHPPIISEEDLPLHCSDSDHMIQSSKVQFFDLIPSEEVFIE